MATIMKVEVPDRGLWLNQVERAMEEVLLKLQEVSFVPISELCWDISKVTKINYHIVWAGTRLLKMAGLVSFKSEKKGPNSNRLTQYICLIENLPIKIGFYYEEEHNQAAIDFPVLLGICTRCGYKGTTHRAWIDHTNLPYKPEYVLELCATCNWNHSKNNFVILFQP